VPQINSELTIMNPILATIQKYLFSGLLIIFGAIFLIKGVGNMSKTEGMEDVSWSLFLIASAGLLFGGIVSALFIAGMINKMTSLILSGLFLIGSIYFAKSNYDSVKDRIALQARYDSIRSNVKQGLTDIRDVQLEYKKVKGKYAESFDSLFYFIENEKTFDIKKQGSTPDGRIGEEYWAKLGYKKTDADFFAKTESWDEDEAVKAGVITKDTVWKPLIEKLFDIESKTQRNRAYSFIVDSLPYVRGYKKGTLRYTMQADTLGDGSPVFLAKEPEPFHIIGKDKDTLQIGSLTDTKTNGNWGER
jgi:hypothetical protein